MPHSPRALGDHVLLLDSGRGMIVRVDPASGRSDDIAFCPGFLRGMTIVGRYAVVAVSKPRNADFGELPLQAELTARGLEPMCGLLVVDLESGRVEHFVRYESEIAELFDVTALPGIRNPTTVGPATEELLGAIRFDPEIRPLD